MAHIVELCSWSANKTIDGKEVTLAGTVLNHPKMPDYTRVDLTSPIQVIYREGDRYIAITRSGTHYRLGVTDAAWASRHPKARQQIIESYHLDINLNVVEGGNSAYGELQ